MYKMIWRLDQAYCSVCLCFH